MFERFFSRKQARLSETIFPGKYLIKFQPQSVEWCFPPLIVGDNESKIVHQVRRILQQKSALFQRLHDEADIAFFEISHSAMSKFRAPAGSSFAEIALLKE